MLPNKRMTRLASTGLAGAAAITLQHRLNSKLR
jgi:hypothetical protein